MKDREQQDDSGHHHQTLDQLVTCPACRRLLSRPRALPCGVCRACDACIRSGGGGGDNKDCRWRCRCGQLATPEAAASTEASVDTEREYLVRLYAQLLAMGGSPGGDGGLNGHSASDEADDKNSTPKRLPSNRASRLAALERRLGAWERALVDEAAAAGAALDAAQVALADARSRLAAEAAAGREALEEARSRVRAAHQERGDVKLPGLPPPPNRLTRWAAYLTSHVTDGLREVADAGSLRCQPAVEPPLIGRRSIPSMPGCRAVAACHVSCTDGYYSDAGGRVLKAEEEPADFAVVGRRPLPPACVAVLVTRQPPLPLRQLSGSQDDNGGRTDRDTTSKVLLLPTAVVDGSDTGVRTATLAPASGSAYQGRQLPLRLAACPTAPGLFLLTLLLLPGRGRRLLVSQCGLDGRPAQTVELRDFRRESGGDATDAAGDWDDDEAAGAAELRIESDARHVVVFSGGGLAQLADGSRAPPVVVLLDASSLRVTQRLRLPDGAAVLHATPGLVWMRHRGRVQLVSQASRQVGRDWLADDQRLCGLFYAMDAAAADVAGSQGRGGRGGSSICGLAVATENCVRLFDQELQPLGCIGGGSDGQWLGMQQPVAVCRCGSVLAVCDALAEQLLLFALE